MKGKSSTIKSITLMALMITLSMMLSYLESRIPLSIAIPGVKVGLANIIVILTLYMFDWKKAVVISLIRVFMMALLFGSAVSMIYGLVGAILSLTLMIILKRVPIFSCVFVSIVGGIMHNVGQILVAGILMETEVFFYYLPYLLISGTIAGLVIGLVSSLLVKRLKPILFGEEKKEVEE